jgi:TonB family protein
MMRSHSSPFVLILLLFLSAALQGHVQPASLLEPPPTLRLDDDFIYQIVDYGLGAVVACPGRTTRVDGVFWIRVKLTNASEHLLAVPKYFSSAAVTDNWGNRYTRTLACPAAKGDRYQPRESAVEIITVAARELVKDLPELRVTLGLPGAALRFSRGAFALQDPLQRRRDVQRGQPEGDPRELHISVANAEPNATATGTPTGTAPAPSPSPTPVQTPSGAYRPGNGVTWPKALREVHPNYTSDALRAKIAGSVALDLLVRPDGTVGDVQVVRSLDSTFGLDQEAIKAAKQWRFSPGMKDGAPVPVIVTIEMMFSLR